jgi:hypothetical protein
MCRPRHRPRSHDGAGQPPEIRHAECSETEGIVTLDVGQWTMHATPGALRIRAEADSEENLHRIPQPDHIDGTLLLPGQPR